MWWRKRGVWALVLAVALVACGNLKDGIEDCKHTSDVIKSELGVDSQISFRTMNGYTTVAVHLSQPPTGDAAAVKGKITGIVNRTFRHKVEQVNVSF